MEQQEMFMVDFQNDNDADLELAHHSFIYFFQQTWEKYHDLNWYKDDVVTCE